MGFSVVAPSIGTLWNNATGQQRIADALAYARSALGATSAKAIFLGTSMGGFSALSWAAMNPTLVKAVYAFLPVVDLQAVRVSNVLGLRSYVDAAWGVTYPAALPAGANVYGRAADLAGIPIRIWSASNDNVSENVAGFVAATGATHTNLGAVGHTDAALAGIDAAAVAEFVRQNI
jgi:S-formylglutathione hydrolase FrmB